MAMKTPNGWKKRNDLKKRWHKGLWQNKENSNMYVSVRDLEDAPDIFGFSPSGRYEVHVEVGNTRRTVSAHGTPEAAMTAARNFMRRNENPNFTKNPVDEALGL